MTTVSKAAAQESPYGPLERLLADPSIYEILIDGPDKVYFELQGKLTDSTEHFRDEAHLMEVLQYITTSAGRRLDESHPIVDVRFSDGSRMNIVIPPIAIHGPYATLRKFAKKPLQVEDLLGFGTWNEDMVTFLRACIKARLNIAIGGGVGSGKTTILNTLAEMIDDEERIVIVQSAGELNFKKKRLVDLETRPANLEGKGEVSMEALVINAMKMRPDRIIVAEVQGAEVIHYLQAMNTGHDGCLFSLHAASPRDVLARLEVMATMGNPSVPLLAVREQMASALDLIVYQERLTDGWRKVTKITEVVGMQGDAIMMQDIFEFYQTGRGPDGKITGQFRPTGIIPKAMSGIRDAGVELLMSLLAPQGWK